MKFDVEIRPTTDHSRVIVSVYDQSTKVTHRMELPFMRKDCGGLKPIEDRASKAAGELILKCMKGA